MKIVASILVLLVLAVGVYVVAGRAQAPVTETTLPSELTPKTYASAMLGLSFVYPGNYFIVERDLSTGERERHSIMLIEDTPGNRALVSGGVEGAEGPTAITIDIFQNDLDSNDADSFIENVSESNFKLAKGDVYGRSVGGDLAIGYGWSGLYEGKSLVVARPDWVYMFSVTYLTPEDEILGDFEDVLEFTSFGDVSEVAR